MGKKRGGKGIAGTIKGATKSLGSESASPSQQSTEYPKRSKEDVLADLKKYVHGLGLKEGDKTVPADKITNVIKDILAQFSGLFARPDQSEQEKTSNERMAETLLRDFDILLEAFFTPKLTTKKSDSFQGLDQVLSKFFQKTEPLILNTRMFAAAGPTKEGAEFMGKRIAEDALSRKIDYRLYRSIFKHYQSARNKLPDEVLINVAKYFIEKGDDNTLESLVEYCKKGGYPIANLLSESLTQLALACKNNDKELQVGISHFIARLLINGTKTQELPENQIITDQIVAVAKHLEDLINKNSIGSLEEFRKKVEIRIEENTINITTKDDALFRAVESANKNGNNSDTISEIRGLIGDGNNIFRINSNGKTILDIANQELRKIIAQEAIKHEVVKVREAIRNSYETANKDLLNQITNLKKEIEKEKEEKSKIQEDLGQKTTEISNLEKRITTLTLSSKGETKGLKKTNSDLRAKMVELQTQIDTLEAKNNKLVEENITLKEKEEESTKEVNNARNERDVAIKKRDDVTRERNKLKKEISVYKEKTYKQSQEREELIQLRDKNKKAEEERGRLQKELEKLKEAQKESEKKLEEQTAVKSKAVALREATEVVKDKAITENDQLKEVNQSLAQQLYAAQHAYAQLNGQLQAIAGGNLMLQQQLAQEAMEKNAAAAERDQFGVEIARLIRPKKPSSRPYHSSYSGRGGGRGGRY